MGKRGRLSKSVLYIVLLVLLCSLSFAFETPGQIAPAINDGTVIGEFKDAQGSEHGEMYVYGIRIKAHHIGQSLSLSGVLLLLPDGREFELWSGDHGFIEFRDDTCEHDCDFTIPWGNTPATFVTGVKFIWSDGGGSDSFEYWFSSPMDSPWTEGKEVLCSDGKDDVVGNDWDGSMDCFDRDCLGKDNCLFACVPGPNNNQVARYETRSREIPSTINFPVYPAFSAPENWFGFGCTNVVPSGQALFDLQLDRMVDRMQAARVFMHAPAAMDVSVRIRWDDDFRLFRYALQDDGSHAGQVPFEGSGSGDRIVSVPVVAGWNEFVFYVWNQGGQGYGTVTLVDKTLNQVFDQMQNAYIPSELDCNDGIDEDSDRDLPTGGTDMGDPDCGIGVPPPAQPDPSQGICERSPPDSPNPLLPGFGGDFLPFGDNPGYLVSAHNAKDSCCGDDPGISEGHCTGPSDCPSRPQKICFGLVGCTWIPPTPSETTDFASVTINNKYLCLNDSTKSRGYTYHPVAPGNWHYWSAPVDQYRLHNVLDLTQYISNGANWYYCDAAGLLNLNGGWGERAEYDPLPESNIPFQVEHIIYQYWPDSDCDQVPNSREDDDDDTEHALGQVAPCADGTDSCYYVEGQRPMSYCEFIDQQPQQDSAHRENNGCRALITPLPDCEEEVPNNPCNPQEWGNSPKEDWTYPDILKCAKEDAPPTGYNDLHNCRDGVDNDYDGKIDCYDADCYVLQAQLQLSHCPPDMELNCVDGIDDDGDDGQQGGGIDCADPDCSGISVCVPAVEETSDEVSQYARFICYENDRQNNFAECCITGKFCSTDGWDDEGDEYYWFYRYKNVFGTGTSFFSSFTSDDLNKADGNTYLDVIHNYDPLEENTVLLNYPLFGGKLDSISMSIWYKERQEPLTFKLIYATGLPSTEYPVTEYIMNGNSPYIWHTLVIPDSSIDDAREITGIDFSDDSYFSIDNVFFKAKTDDYSSPRYCAGTGAWISDLDQEEGACNAQNPQGMNIGGFGGTGWTGSRCCGDDVSGNLLENPGFEAYAVNHEIGSGPQPNGWSKKDGTDLAKVELVEGGKAVHIRADSVNEGIYSLFSSFGNNRYVMSARVKIVSGSVQLGKGNEQCFHVFQKPEGNPHFIDISVEFNNAQCGGSQYLAYVYSGSANAEFYVDDVSLISLPEYYADADRGCFGNNVINKDRVVGDLFRTELSQGGNKDEFKDLLFYDAAFWVCRPNTTDATYASFADTVTSNPLVPTNKYLELCDLKGSYYCSVAGQWKDGSHESETFILEEGNRYGFSGGTRVRCSGGDPVVVNEVYDWFGKHKNECNVGKCFCPTKLLFGNAGYQDCDDFNTSFGTFGRAGTPLANHPGKLDRQSCMESGGIFYDHFCNAGNWMTRTSLVAGLLLEDAQSKDEDNFVLSCNMPSAILYEEYLGDEIGHLSGADIESLFDSVCVLDIRNANWETESVIVGFALKTGTDVTPDDIGEKMNEAFGSESEAGTRLNVNYRYVQDNSDDLPWSACRSTGRCVNADRDHFKVYHFEDVGYDKGLFFFTTDDLRRDNLPEIGNETYFEKLELLWDVTYKSLMQWVKPKAAANWRIPELSTAAKRVYIAQRSSDGAVSKRVMVSIEEGFATGAPASSGVVLARFFGFDNLALPGQLSRLYPNLESEVRPDGELFLIAPTPGDVTEGIIAKLYQIRLDDVPG
jgi:hypothetical protein